MKKIVLIVVSDPHSVNYEIIKKSLFFFKNKRKNKYIFIGCKKEFFKKIRTKNKNINFINIKKNTNTKIYLKNCFEKAFKLLQKRHANALINMPLDKKFLPKNYVGFTEYISDFFKKKNKTTMLLFNNSFSVCPNTTHIPLKLVSSKLSKKKIITNIKNILVFYKQIIKIKNPKIALMGLNPHNGTDFNFSTEENKIIIPLINSKKFYPNKILGPISPDTAFNRINKLKLNCLVGNYHDQVLPTFKYINNFNAINITLGLPFLRISPDHGVATDIIGKNLANPDSFLYALNFLEKYYKRI